MQNSPIKNSVKSLNFFLSYIHISEPLVSIARVYMANKFIAAQIDLQIHQTSVLSRLIF